MKFSAQGPSAAVATRTDPLRGLVRQRAADALLDEVDAGVVTTDLDGTVTLWSRGAKALYGWTEEEAVGQPVTDLTVPGHLRDRLSTLISRLRRETHWTGDLELQRKDGTRFIACVRSSVMADADGVPVGFIGISEDATERVVAEEELRRSRDYLTAVTDSMGEGLITVDHSGAILYMNATAEKRLGWTRDELLGASLHEKIHHHRPDGSAHPAEASPVNRARLTREVIRVREDVFLRRDGSPLPVSYTVSPFELSEGGAGAVILFADMTNRVRADRALRASEAQLKAIVENTSAAIYVKRKGDYRYLLGNPEFERIHGLEAGRAAGSRDEELLSPETVEAMRESDRRVIEEDTEIELEEEMAVAGGEPHTYLTLKFPLPDENGTPYALCGISTDITERKRHEAELSERLDWEERIRRAVDEDRLLVYAQPIIELRSGDMALEELLVRMRGTALSDDIIPPAGFLPQAERFGVVGQIDRFMVRRGIELAAAGRCVQINLSGHSIGDLALTRQIERELHRTGADPSKIVFEITETAAVEDMQAAQEFSVRIARLGCKCALDDFGTGFGSLTYQRHLAVQYLKIDKSFVSAMAGSAADQQVVKSIVKLARDYGQQTVAEGVEDEQTLELLRALGVDYAQGYHLGRPEALAER